MKSKVIGKGPDVEKDGRQKRKGQRKMRWLESITNTTAVGLSKLWEIAKDRGTWGAAVHGVTKNQTQLRAEQ